MFYESQFSFPLRDRDGKVQSDPSWFRGQAKYRGTLSDDDPLVVAIRKLNEESACSFEELDWVRSFCFAWLNGEGTRLSEVLMEALLLPDAVLYVGRIGWLRRQTVEVIDQSRMLMDVVTLLNATVSHASIGFQPPSIVESLGGVVVDAAIGWALDKTVLDGIDQKFSAPGQPCPPSAFNAEHVFALLRLCQLHLLMDRLDFAQATTEALQRQLMKHIYVLFLANSRQIEGLLLCGNAEVSAALATHAAIAVGLTVNPNTENILNELEQELSLGNETPRMTEAKQTLATIRQNANEDAKRLGTRIQRQLVSASTTEVIDLVTLPVSTTINLLALASKGVGHLAGDGFGKSVLSGLESTLKQAATGVNETSGVIGMILRGGLSTEEWARRTVNRFWPLSKRETLQ